MTLHLALCRPDNERDCRYRSGGRDGTIQLFAPAQIASHVAGNRVRDGPDSVSWVRSYSLCAILYAIPATAVLGAIQVTGFLGRCHLRSRPHW